MEVIYIDSLFFLNLGVDYLLCLAAARICGLYLRRRRYVLAALLGAFSMAFLDSFMNIFVTGCWYLQIVKGILFVVVVFLFTIGKRSKLLAR